MSLARHDPGVIMRRGSQLLRERCLAIRSQIRRPYRVDTSAHPTGDAGGVDRHQLSFPVSICQYITQSALNESQGWSKVAGRFFS